MQASGTIQNDSELQHREQPEWLHQFLQTTTFGPCAIHQSLKNELRKYCITCTRAVCQHCADRDSHSRHDLLKIYRHVYKDAVLVKEMEEHINCSKIQTYKCNKNLVLSLTPLPHCGLQTSGEASCDTCMRKLYNAHVNRFCSIICKVLPTQEKRSKRPRKGIPQRAALP